jgi:hypothetical protein
MSGKDWFLSLIKILHLTVNTLLLLLKLTEVIYFIRCQSKLC